MASLFVVICPILIIFALISSQEALGARIEHNELTSFAETEEEILLHSNGRDPKFFDPKLANEFELIRPENIRESYENVFPDKAYVPTNGTYIIFKPKYLVINNNDVVNISFKASVPMSSDWIGAFSPASDSVTLSQTVPVKFGWCDTVYGSSYYTQKNDGRYGWGWMTFNFTNLRADISFVYFTNALNAAVVVNRSDFIVTFKNFNQPLKPRVTPTGNPDVYNISWSSFNSTSPVLKWGTAIGGPYTNTVVAFTSNISKSQMRGYPANSIGWRDLGLIHTASFYGMEALSSTNIYYKYGDLTTNDFSNETILLVAPKKGDSPNGRGTRVVLFDDLGRGSRDTTYTWNEYGRPSIRTAEMVGAEIANGTVDAVYHGGDISYATGYMAVWDFYANMMAPVASAHTIYLTTVGNHESDCPNSASYWNGTDSGGECGVLATTLYTQPAPSVTNKPWWSYDVGIIHFVGMSTEHNFTMGSPQWLWLKNDLENVNRSATPWVIFGGHRAMYLNSYYCCSSSTYTNPVDACGGLDGCSPTSDIAVMHDMVTNIEPLLFANKVNFAFYGHNHVVQRQSATLNYNVIQKSKPTTINGETVNFYDDPQATVHFVIGTGGANFTKNAFFNKSSPLYPVWNELFYYQYGYARVEAINASYLAYEWVLNDDGSILDRTVIYQADPFASFDPSSKDDDDDSTSSSMPKLSTPFIIAIAVVVPAVVILFGIFLYCRSKTLSPLHIDEKSPLHKSDNGGDITPHRI